MNIVTITEPLTLRPGQLDRPTRFVVASDMGDQYAVTIEGNWKTRENPWSEDRFDGIWPAIQVDCNYLSRGVLLNRVDNADFDPIRVTESNGPAVEFRSLRQCHFGSVRAHRCKSTSRILLFSGNDQSYSTNMINMGQVVCMGCDAPVTVEMVNASKNDVRIITIAQLICHIAWEPLRQQFPGTRSFGPRNRVHLALNDATAITIVSCNLRMDAQDPDTARAITTSNKAEDCIVSGGQILKVRGRSDLGSLVVGNVVVFPHRRKA